LKSQKRVQISKPTGLLVDCPESVLKVKEISTQKLWYDLYAPRSYIVKRTDETICKYLICTSVETDTFISILTFRMLDTIGRENA